MIIQDKNVKRWLKIANCMELTESMETFPENESMESLKRSELTKL